jgi:hypothetical protein
MEKCYLNSRARCRESISWYSVGPDVTVARMQEQNAAARAKESQLNVLTLAGIGALACIAADMVHEAVGHGIASWLVADPILSLSTVAIQTSDPSRVVSAAGTTVNVIVGVLSLLLLRRVRSLTPSAYFLWAFGAFNLFNVGYLVASAAMNSGDWAAVMSGLSPPWLWRCALGLVGIIFYVLSVRWVASFAVAFVNHRQVAVGDGSRLVWPAYLSAGVVLTVASIFNPISPSLILGSGVGASFGLNCGFLFVPPIVAAHANYQGVGNARIPFSAYWLIVSLFISGLFIDILGPGIRFSH